MKLFIKFDINTICSLFLKHNLDQHNVNFTTLGFGEIEISDNLDANALEALKNKLSPCGFEVVENQKSVLVQKIKDAIIELVFMEDNNNYKSSVFLAEKLNHSYGYLSNVFSEVTYSSIENFIILQKIERAKQLIIINEMSLTEIAFLLNYSSVAHLSTQFKNTTGITPSAFQRIIKKRRENLKIKPKYHTKMQNNALYILLADDDEDDRLFFNDAFEEIKIQTKVDFVHDGMQLMEHLMDTNNKLPDILFLDLNMPKKTGKECLIEIKKTEHLKNIIIAIYSTSSSEEDIEDTFIQGANIYIKKPSDFNTLKKIINEVVTVNWHYHTSGLNRDNFLLRLK